MIKKEINNSKEQQIGVPYQILVGIDYACVHLYSKWDKMSIEHEGDVTFDKKVQIEVKHHNNKISLGNRDEEFWKTLRNWIRKPDISKFDRLILHTTKHLPKTSTFSILKNWNSNRDNGKTKENFNNIKKRAFTKQQIKKGSLGTLKFYKEIFDNNSDKDIIAILNKVELKLNQLNFEDYLKFMSKENPVFASIGTKKEVFIKEELVEWINSKVSETEWSVSSKDFFNQFHKKVESFNSLNYLTYFNKYENAEISEQEIKSYYENNFARKLEEIDCPIKDKEKAIQDYISTQKLLGDINDNVDIFFIEDIYLNYRKNKIYEKLDSEKKQEQLKKHDARSNHEELLFYYKTQSWDTIPYKRIITSDYDYFQRGTIHDVAQDDDEEFNFDWKFE